MRVISKRALEQFWSKHAESAQPLQGWLDIVSKNELSTFADLKAIFRSVDLVGNRLVFDIKGNSYRFVCGVDFQRGILYIKFVGTHAEYDRIDVRTAELR